MAGTARPHGGISALGALRIANPAEWERRIREALDAEDGKVPEAAVLLGCSTRQLYRWLGKEPRLADINSVRARRLRSKS
jgi:hypothetical protein